MTFTCPFEYAQLPSMYRHFFNEPLSFNIDEVKKKIEETLQFKVETEQKKSKNKKSIKKNVQKPSLIDEKKAQTQNMKRNTTSQPLNTAPLKMQKSQEDSSFIQKSDGKDLIEYCKSVGIKDVKANQNDPISLLTQLCEYILKFRPEYEFELCGVMHRCIIRIPQIGYERQETASNKKKAKSEVCIQSLQEVFPKVYSDWISLNTQRKEIAQKEDQIFQEEESKFNQSLVQQVRWNTANDAVINNQMEARQSSPSKIDLCKVTVDDPNLLDYPELVTKYTPKTLLEKYESTVKRGKLKIVRTLSENCEHVCTIKFHTEEKSLEAKETHATNSMYATHFACQKMLRQLFPHQWIWVNLVNYIDSLPVIEKQSTIQSSQKPTGLVEQIKQTKADPIVSSNPNKLQKDLSEGDDIQIENCDSDSLMILD